jgi:hypothetical protein
MPKLNQKKYSNIFLRNQNDFSLMPTIAYVFTINGMTALIITAPTKLEKVIFYICQNGQNSI